MRFGIQGRSKNHDKQAIDQVTDYAPGSKEFSRRKSRPLQYAAVCRSIVSEVLGEISRMHCTIQARVVVPAPKLFPSPNSAKT